MRLPTRLLLLITLLSAINLCTASTLEALTHTVLRQSGVNEQIQQFPNTMHYKIEQIYDMGKCDEQSFTVINAAIEKTLNRHMMSSIVSKELISSLSQAQLEHIEQWYNGELGKKITALELTSSEASALEQMRLNKDKLLNNRQRLTLIKKIDEALQASDWAVNIDLQSTIALLGALAQAQNKNITPNLVKFAGQMYEQKALLRPQIEKSIHAWYLFTYASLSNSELETYIAFLENNETQAFNKIALKGLAHAITINVENFIIEVEKNSKNTSVR